MDLRDKTLIQNGTTTENRQVPRLNRINHDWLSQDYPFLVVDCLEYLIEFIEMEWKLHYWIPQFRIVIENAIAIGANERIDAIINKLAARGILDFRDLLST